MPLILAAFVLSDELEELPLFFALHVADVGMLLMFGEFAQTR